MKNISDELLSQLGQAFQEKATELFGHVVPAVIIIPGWRGNEAEEKTGFDLLSNIDNDQTLESLKRAAAIVAEPGVTEFTDKPAPNRGLH